MNIQHRARLRALLPLVFWLAAFASTALSEPAAPLVYLEQATFPPYVYISDDGEVSGVAPTIIRELLNSLGYRVTIHNSPDARIILDAADGRTDILTALTFTGLTREDYPPHIHICPNPLGKVPLAVFVRRGDVPPIPTDKIMTEGKVGAVMYAKFKRGFSEQYEIGNITRYKDSDKLFKALNAKRIDYAISDPYIVQYIVGKNPGRIPIDLLMEAGQMEIYLAVSEIAQQRYQLLKPMCEGVRQMGFPERFNHLLENENRELLGRKG